MNQKRINIDTYLTLGTHRYGLFAKEASVSFDREVLADESLEYRAKRELPGAFMYPASLAGDASIATEQAALEQLRLSGEYAPYLKVRGNAPGTRGLMGEARVKNFAQQGPANQLSTFSAELTWRGHPTKRAYLLANHMKGGALTASGDGVAVLLPAVAADEEIVAGLVEPDFPGSSGDDRTLDVKTQSATDSGFTAGVVDRHAFTQITTDPASEWATPIPGPVASLWWHVTWAVAGTDPNFFSMIFVGIRKAK